MHLHKDTQAVYCSLVKMALLVFLALPGCLSLFPSLSFAATFNFVVDDSDIELIGESTIDTPFNTLEGYRFPEVRSKTGTRGGAWYQGDKLVTGEVSAADGTTLTYRSEPRDTRVAYTYRLYIPRVYGENKPEQLELVFGARSYQGGKLHKGDYFNEQIDLTHDSAANSDWYVIEGQLNYPKYDNNGWLNSYYLYDNWEDMFLQDGTRKTVEVLLVDFQEGSSQFNIRVRELAKPDVTVNFFESDGHTLVEDQGLTAHYKFVQVHPEHLNNMEGGFVEVGEIRQGAGRENAYPLIESLRENRFEYHTTKITDQDVGRVYAEVDDVDLAKNPSGKRIVGEYKYLLKEEYVRDIPGYTKTVTGDDHSGYVITFTRKGGADAKSESNSAGGNTPAKGGGTGESGDPSNSNANSDSDSTSDPAANTTDTSSVNEKVNDASVSESAQKDVKFSDQAVIVDRADETAESGVLNKTEKHVRYLPKTADSSKANIIMLMLATSVSLLIVSKKVSKMA